MTSARKPRGEQTASAAMTMALADEQALIGAVLDGAAHGQDVMAAVNGASLTDCFQVAEHRELWTAMLALHGSGKPLHPDLVFDAAKHHPACSQLRASNMVDWMERVTGWFSPPTLAQHHASRIREAYTRRQCVNMASDLAAKASSDPRPMAEWFHDQMAPLMRLHTQDAVPTLSQDVAEVVSQIDARADGTAQRGIASGLPGIDTHLCGFQPGHITVVAGRTSMGKTSFALTVAHHALRAGTGVGIVSCEMSRGELIERLLAQQADISLTRIRRSYLASADRQRIRAAAEAIAGWPLKIEDRLREWTAVENVLRTMVGNGARLLVVDYLGLLQVRGKLSRWEQIGLITAELKRLAVLLRVPILVLCQINREVAQAKDKRPALWNLRDSGSVEQDADVIIMLHRPGQYDQTVDRAECEAIVGKNRHGPDGFSVPLRFDAETASFKDGAEEGDWFDCAGAPESQGGDEESVHHGCGGRGEVAQ